MPHSLIPPLHARISLVLAGLALLAVACGGPEASDQLSAAEEAATVPQPNAAEPTTEPASARPHGRTCANSRSGTHG